MGSVATRLILTHGECLSRVLLVCKEKRQTEMCKGISMNPVGYLVCFPHDLVMVIALHCYGIPQVDK